MKRGMAELTQVDAPFDPESGDASGGGNDQLLGGPGDDRMTGDSFSVSGDANGGGSDRLEAGDGSDNVNGDSHATGGGSACSWRTRARWRAGRSFPPRGCVP